MMLVKHAKDVARAWVQQEASSTPAFYGAFFAGSTNWMPDNAPLPPSSDVDVKVIVDDSHPYESFRKFLFQDVVLEISYDLKSHFQSPETILTDYTLAAHFTTPNIIVDPSGHLTTVQAIVQQNFAKRPYVHKRCEHARDWLVTSLHWLNESDPLHDQVFASMYAAGVPTHIILVADLQNPTVRRTYVAARDVLNKYGRLSLHETLLSIMGSVHLSRRHVQDLLAACAEVFDVAKEVIRTPFFGSAQINDFARPLAIDGSQELIEQGYHREAVFWIAVTHTWCQKVLYNDASEELQEKFLPSYQRLLHDLGITSFSDLVQRREQLTQLLPQIWDVTEAIIAANPKIER